MKALSEAEKSRLSTHLKSLAKQAWQKSCGGVWQIALDKDLSLQNAMNYKGLELAREDLLSSGLKEIFHLNRGSHGKVFYGEYTNAQQIAIRHGEIEAGARSQCPVILAPFKSWINESQITEAMPLVSMLKNSALSKPVQQKEKVSMDYDIFDQIGEIVLYITEQSGFHIWAHDWYKMRDFALLPNGVPVQVDPDNVAPVEAHELTQAFDKFAKLQDELNLPPELQWLDAQGRRAQDKFFKNPFTPK